MQNARMNIYLGSGFRAAISSREDGNMRVGADDFGAVLPEREATRKRFLSHVGMPTALVTGILAHGSRVAVVRDAVLPYLPETDALVTDVPGISIGVTVADCVPVFLADGVRHAVGIAHAGWRGIVAGVLENTVAAMVREYGSDPATIRAFVGPRIRECHYEVSADVADRFPAECRTVRDGRIFLDLGLACRMRLVDSGLAPENVSVSNECTACDAEKFFSFRRDKPPVPEAMLATIAVRR